MVKVKLQIEYFIVITFYSKNQLTVKQLING